MLTVADKAKIVAEFGRNPQDTGLSRGSDCIIICKNR